MDAITDFLERLSSGRTTDLPETFWGTIRLDIRRGDHTDHWFITAERGRVFSSRGDRPADLVVYADEELFNRFATGEANIVAALLRNEMNVEGKMRLGTMLRRVFPGPPGAHIPGVRAANGRRES
jgi:hypothetical protein